MNKIFLATCMLFLSQVNKAASVDTIAVFSNAMHKSSKVVVIKPEGYTETNQRFPVLYLLHGYSDNYSTWIQKVPSIQQLADQYRLMIVCPDGGFSSWYFDSPVDSNFKYETYVALEVPTYIDAHYKTIANRHARAITGLSMGGHGGLFLGFRHADLFGACGSMSGGVDLNFSRKKFDVAKRIGDTIRYADNWTNYSVIHQVESYPKDSISIIIDCGTEDFFYSDNKRLHQKMLQLKIPHDYIERPGIHNWLYWTNAIRYQLLFFSDYFKKYSKD
ncbi:MAG: esterase family protein [Bacteroidota bacterium]|nr:esterase family protein [Bacteroidota bacterium]